MFLVEYFQVELRHKRKQKENFIYFSILKHNEAKNVHYCDSQRGQIKR